MEKGRITIISHDYLFPVNHGGRIDIFNQITTFKKLNFDIQFIYWSKKDEIIDDGLKLFSSVINFSSKRDVLSFLRYFYLPFPIATHTCTRDELKNAEDMINSFKPDIIIVEGLLGGYFYLKVKNRLATHKIVYRSQNIEFLHNYIQIKSSKSVALKIKHLFDMPRMFFFEYYFRSLVNNIWDISEKEKNYFGGKSKAVLPNLPEAASVVSQPGDQIVFFGNLHNPNNIDGLVWFMKFVFPLLPRLLKEKIIFAGSNPHKRVYRIVNGSPIKIVPNPVDINLIVKCAALLMNPIRHSTGINIKTVEMLQTGLKIISCSAGVNGIPDVLASYISVHDDARAFAESIQHNYQLANINYDQVQKTRSMFSDAGLKQRLEELR